MSSSLRDAARDAFCDVLLQVGPSVPTLCEGWDTHRLAAHVWSLTYDPAAWLGMVVKPFNAMTERRLGRIIARWPYEELVARLRRMEGFRRVPCDGRRGHRHALGEYVIHTEDVRRPTDCPHPGPALTWRRPCGSAFRWRRDGCTAGADVVWYWCARTRPATRTSHAGARGMSSAGR